MPMAPRSPSASAKMVSRTMPSPRRPKVVTGEAKIVPPRKCSAQSPKTPENATLTLLTKKALALPKTRQTAEEVAQKEFNNHPFTLRQRALRTVAPSEWSRWTWQRRLEHLNSLEARRPMSPPPASRMRPRHIDPSAKGCPSPRNPRCSSPRNPRCSSPRTPRTPQKRQASTPRTSTTPTSTPRTLASSGTLSNSSMSNSSMSNLASTQTSTTSTYQKATWEYERTPNHWVEVPDSFQFEFYNMGIEGGRLSRGEAFQTEIDGIPCVVTLSKGTITVPSYNNKPRKVYAIRRRERISPPPSPVNSVLSVSCHSLCSEFNYLNDFKFGDSDADESRDDA